MGVFVACDDSVEEFLFHGFELHDFFLDGVAHEEALDEDGLLLTHAMRAVAGLVFDGRIPPGIEMEDVAGAGQIQACTSGLEADEEKGRAFASLIVFDEGLALLLRGAAVEALEGDLVGLEMQFEEVERLRKLAENEGGMAFCRKFLRLLDKMGDLWRDLRMCGIDEGRGDADLAQPSEC